MEKRYPLIHLNDETIVKEKLNSYTFARVNLPKTEFAISLTEVLAFRADHAAARDAIFTPFEIEAIQAKLKNLNQPYLIVSSQAETKEAYLKRPDLGRILDKDSEALLSSKKGTDKDIVIVVTNGLSATAVNENAAPLLHGLIPKIKDAHLKLAPLIYANNGRVAIADPIGEILHARLSIILVGERPGLSSPDSMSVYFTYAPEKGLTDEARNCISNIRPKGLPPELAAEKLFYLINKSLTQKISGVHLKDDMGLPE